MQILDINGEGCASDAALLTNTEHSKTLGLPFATGSGRLAVVGGGVSVLEHADELRAWDGDIWAINGAFNWCRDNGIDAAFFTIDPNPIQNWEQDLSRVRRAVLSVECDPTLFERLRGAEIFLTPVLCRGPTTATAAPALAIWAGYSHATFFGCESSADKQTHAYAHIPSPDWMTVEAGGRVYHTKAEFFMQAHFLAGSILRALPAFFAEKSGGLLRALAEHNEYKITDIAPSLSGCVKEGIVPCQFSS